MLRTDRKYFIFYTFTTAIFLYLLAFFSPFYKINAQTTPLLYTTLENSSSVTNPINGTGTGSIINTTPSNDFVPAQVGNGIRIDNTDEYVKFQQTDGTIQNVELEKGTVEFWYQPFYNHNDGNAYRIFGIGTSNSPGFIGLYKRTAQYGNDLYFYIKDANNVNRQTRVSTSNYSWNVGDWVKLRITWDATLATGVQNARIYINDQQVPAYTQTNKGPFPMPQESTSQYIFIGVVNSGEIQHANGIIDEFAIYNEAIPPAPLPTPTPTPNPSPDNTPPVVSVTNPTDGATILGTITVSADAFDDVAVAGVQFQIDGVNFGSEDTSNPYSINWDTTSVTNGPYSLNAVARDTSNNTTISTAISVTVDNPQIINLLTNPGFESGGTGWTASSNGGRAVVTTEFHSGAYSQEINSSSQWEREVYQTVSIAQTDNYQTSVWVKTAGIGGAGAFVEMIWLDNTSSVLRTDTLAQLAGDQPWTFFTGIFTPPQQATMLKFRLFNSTDPDNAGKAWYDDTEVLTTQEQPTDTQPPFVSITSPVDTSTVSYIIPAVASASDNVGVVGVQFYLDGNPLQSEDTTSPYSINLDTTAFSDGNHTLVAVARDAASNTTTSALINITVNNTDRPNIVFILTDDQRGDTMQYMPLTNGLLGSQSVIFNNATVSTSLCCPSRSSILTGQYAHNHGVHFTSAPNGGAVTFNDSSTIATWLYATGYRTSLIGKYLNAYSVISPHIPPGWSDWNVMIDNELFYDYSLNENGTVVPYGSSPSDYSTDVFTNKAISFINSTPINQPLLLYVAPIAPHYPYTPAPQDIGLFSGIELWRPPSFNEADVSDKPQWIQQLSLLTQTKIDLNDSVRQQQIESLQAVDRQVEAIMNTLQQTGRLDNTMIIYTSDNGFMWGEHRIIEDKLCAYEECGRVPLWVRLPGGTVSRSDDNLVQNIDFAPTIAELAGVPVPTTVNGKNVNGVSFLTLLNNPQTPWTTEVLYEGWGHYGGQTNLRGFSAVRTAQYMYGEYKNGDRELYDFITDPYQLNNIVNDPSYATIVTDLQNRLTILKQK